MPPQRLPGSKADIFLGAIIEGPRNWPVRPVAEIFREQDFGAGVTRSALIGAFWQMKDDVAVDFGLRGARISGHTAGEGVTFALAAP